MGIRSSMSDAEKLVTINIGERFDFNQVQDFRDSYAQCDDKINHIVVDMRETEYIDSSALGMLLNMKKHFSEKTMEIEIANCRPQVKKILAISRFDKKFKIH